MPGGAATGQPRVRTRARWHILSLGTIANSAALARAGGHAGRRRCPLPPEVSRYAGLCLVSVASPPHHLQATHLVFRPTRAEPKHFLLVTQPPGRAGGGEGGRGRVNWGESESGSQPRNEHITASFPPCSAPVWSDSSSARPKGEPLPRLWIARYPCSSSHSLLTLLDRYFSVNCHIS